MARHRPRLIRGSVRHPPDGKRFVMVKRADRQGEREIVLGQNGFES